MENNKDLKTTVDEFLTEENELKKDNKPTEEENKIVQEKCQTQECRMKNKDGIIERIEKKYVTSDGRVLLND